MQHRLHEIGVLSSEPESIGGEDAGVVVGVFKGEEGGGITP